MTIDLEQDEANFMLLTFRFDGEVFAFPVTRVHEVIDPISYTPVPNASAFAPGVINVRGIVVPLLDVRKRLLMPEEAETQTSRIIVFEINIAGTSQKLAFRADSVEQVLESTPEDLEPVPELGAIWPRRFVRGALRHNEELIILLDSNELFAPTQDVPEPAHA